MFVILMHNAKAILCTYAIYELAFLILANN